MIHKPLKKFTALQLLTAVIVAQCACTAQTQPQEPAAQTSFGEDWLLNTYCYIQTYEAGQESLIRQAFSAARDLENQLSRTIETSDIGRFNASEDGCEVSEHTAFLWSWYRYFLEGTGGKFDPTVGSLTELWNFSADEPHVPGADAIAEALMHVGNWDDLSMEAEQVGRSVYEYRLDKTDPGIKLDFGASAKGYIAQLTAAFLRGEGVSRAIINFGGNVVFVGAKEDGSDWVCGIEDPAEGRSDALIQDRGIVGLVHCRPQTEEGDVAVVTSGTYERCFEEDGVLYHHVLDPATGYPVETDLLSATVIGPEATLCDILSTCCLLLGSEKGLELVENFDLQPESYEAVFILKDGSIITTDGADFEEN